MVLNLNELQSLVSRLCDTGLEGVRRHRCHVLSALRVLERELLDAIKDLLVVVRELAKFSLLVFKAHRLLDWSTSCCGNRSANAH